jgi:hypothetical protein
VAQNAIMSTDIPSYLMRCVQPQFSAEVRVAALWCVINLCWHEGDGVDNHDRLLALRSRGLEAQLRAIRDDVSMEIKVRGLPLVGGAASPGVNQNSIVAKCVRWESACEGRGGCQWGRACVQLCLTPAPDGILEHDIPSGRSHARRVECSPRVLSGVCRRRDWYWIRLALDWARPIQQCRPGMGFRAQPGLSCGCCQSTRHTAAEVCVWVWVCGWMRYVQDRVSTALTLFQKLGPHTDATATAVEGLFASPISTCDDPADTLMSDS